MQIGKNIPISAAAQKVLNVPFRYRTALLLMPFIFVMICQNAGHHYYLGRVSYIKSGKKTIGGQYCSRTIWKCVCRFFCGPLVYLNYQSGASSDFNEPMQQCHNKNHWVLTPPGGM